MYAQQASWFPALEHADELRAVLEARAKFQHSQGIRAQLTQDMGFGANAPAFHIVLVFDGLAAFQAYRENQRDSVAKLRADTMPLVRQTGRASLVEVLVRAQPSSTPANYLLRMVSTPLPGKGGELRALQAEWTAHRNALGYRSSLSSEVAGPATGSLITNIRLERLEEIEALRSLATSDQAAQEYVRKASPLQAGFPATEILQVLVDFPQAQA